MNLTKKTIFFISGFIFSVLFFGLAGGVQAQTACPSATTPGLLLCEDFEDNSWSDSFDGTYNSENVSIVNSRALSGLYSVRMYGGYLGAALDYHIARSNNSMIYIKYYQYFPSGEWDWSGLSETGMKQFRVQPGDGWPLFMFKNNPNPTTHTYFSEGTNPAHPSGISMWRNIGSFPSSNNWHKVEIVVRWSDTNGGYSWKVDDVLIAGNENFAYDTWPPAAGSISNLRIGGGNGFPSGSSYYIDNVEIWDRLPGSSATCSNCCSSTQTCPTAFTTVGACTRCCASTCQAASTDTTAPRVTAFTITPTTLTVGASITANYTVTDNTALSRVELWYANYNSSNCNETNRTGCVWNQIVSNNISGTSQSGTISYTPHTLGSFMNGLHAVDAAGNIGYESAAVRVTVNAAAQTCSNCCSTTQTCPTAMTTVGSCTRCCATACQNATSGGLSITSASGTFNSGNTITISGSGFGTKSQSSPLLWDDFENGTLGARLNTSPKIGSWTLISDPTPTVYSSNYSHSGSKSAYTAPGTRAYGNMRVNNLENFDKLYWSFWFRYNSGGASGYQTKLFQLWGNGPDQCDYGPGIMSGGFADDWFATY